METKDSIRQLLEMLDNPQAYSETEIRDIINRDEDSRETYRMMVEAKRTSRRKRTEEPADVDAAWQRFLDKRQLPQRKRDGAGIYKIAASFIGLLFVSGIAFAAIRIAHSGEGNMESTAQETQVSNAPQTAAPADTLRTGDTAAGPVVFDNVPFDKMLTEIAAYYQTEAVFLNEEARQLRFYFVWYKEQPLEKVVETLNHFERVNIGMDDQKLMVR